MLRGSGKKKKKKKEKKKKKKKKKKKERKRKRKKIAMINTLNASINNIILVKYISISKTTKSRRMALFYTFAHISSI